MKINTKFLNWSAWITLIIAYVFPYQSADGIATYFGYPFSIFTFYKTSLNRSLNLPAFILNVLIIYFAINIANMLLIKHKSNKDKKNNSL